MIKHIIYLTFLINSVISAPSFENDVLITPASRPIQHEFLQNPHQAQFYNLASETYKPQIDHPVFYYPQSPYYSSVENLYQISRQDLSHLSSGQQIENVAPHHFYDDTNQRFAAVKSPLPFIENFESFHHPFASTQDLKPIKREQDKNVKQYTMSRTMSTTAATLTFRNKEADGDDDSIDTGTAIKGSKSDRIQSASKLESTEKDRDLSDESSIAQAKPSGIAIAGNGGVASSKPVANAISGPNGLSVASPSATALAGDFAFGDDYDDDRKKPRRPNLTVQAYRQNIRY